MQIPLRSAEVVVFAAALVAVEVEVVAAAAVEVVAAVEAAVEVEVVAGAAIAAEVVALAAAAIAALVVVVAAAVAVAAIAAEKHFQSDRKQLLLPWLGLRLAFEPWLPLLLFFVPLEQPLLLLLPLVSSSLWLPVFPLLFSSSLHLGLLYQNPLFQQFQEHSQKSRPHHFRLQEPGLWVLPPQKQKLSFQHSPKCPPKYYPEKWPRGLIQCHRI